MKSTETMLRMDNYNEAVEIKEFLETLNPDEKKNFLTFIQGAKFALGIKKSIQM